jgi:hypothetical protein
MNEDAFAWSLPYRRYRDFDGFSKLFVLDVAFCMEWQAQNNNLLVGQYTFQRLTCSICPFSNEIGSYHLFSVGHSKRIIKKAWRSAGFLAAVPNPSYREPEQLFFCLSDFDYGRACINQELLG